MWQQRIIRKIFNIKWYQYVSFFDIVSLAAKYDYKILPIECRIRHTRLKYFGHVERMDDTRLPKIILHAECVDGQRLVGQPEINFRNCLKNDLVLFNIKNWKLSIMDRKKWRQDLFNGKEYFLRHWWTVWTKKYSARHNKEQLRSKNTKYSKASEVQRKLDSILDHEKTLSIVFAKNDSNHCNNSISFVKVIVLIDNCIRDMIKEVELRVRFDFLDSNEAYTGSRNILISESVSSNSRKYRKASAIKLMEIPNETVEHY